MSSVAKKGDWPIQATKKINKLCGADRGKKPLLGDTIQVGNILTTQKERMGRTKWGHWVDAVLPFSRPTAQRYMQLYRAFLMGQKSGEGF